MPWFVLMAALDAADVRGVNFDFTKEIRGVLVLHRLADTVCHVPRGAIGADAKVLFELVRRHALLCVYDQRESHEPLCKRQVRVIEDGAGRGRELLRAIGVEALIDARPLVLALALAGDLADALGAANRAGDTIRPAHRFEVS